MSNRRFARGARRKPKALCPTDRKPPATYDAKTLHTMLVQDGVRRWIGGHEELAYLHWLTAALERIAQLDGVGADQALLRVDGEVFELCGRHLRVA